jgi:hypothetical protein
MAPMTTVRILPTRRATRILVTDPNGDEVLKAQLPPAGRMHRLAARTLLEAIALFYNARIRVVLSVDSEAISFELGLSDGLGTGIDTFYYEVEILPSREQRRRLLRGLGDFRDVRHLTVLEGGKQ